MIRILTKTRHKKEISDFLNTKNVAFEIYTRFDKIPDSDYDLGVSYCWSKLIKEPDLSRPKKGWINYHTAPLPEYPGGDPYTDGFNDKVMKWGVTLHYMDENYDTGPIIERRSFPLHHPPLSRQELGAIAHYNNMTMFKETITNY